MSKDNKLGKVIFAVGVLIFIGALGYGYLIKGANALIANCIMGFGLVVEFVGLCFTYRGEKNEENREKKDVETKTIEEIKAKERIMKKDDVVEAKVKEVKKEETKEEKTKATPKKTTSSSPKKAPTKKSGNTSKKKGPAKKKTTPKKKK